MINIAFSCCDNSPTDLPSNWRIKGLHLLSLSWFSLNWESCAVAGEDGHSSSGVGISSSFWTSAWKTLDWPSCPCCPKSTSHSTLFSCFWPSSLTCKAVCSLLRSFNRSFMLWLAYSVLASFWTRSIEFLASACCFFRCRTSGIVFDHFSDCLISSSACLCACIFMTLLWICSSSSCVAQLMPSS